MTADTPSPLAPKLRFPEFRDGPAWKLASLDELSEFVSDRISVTQLSVSTYVSTENILPDFGGMTNAAKLPSTHGATRFMVDDILVSNIRPYLRKIWQADRDGGASNDVIVIRPKEGVLKRYLPTVLRSDAFIAYMMKGAKGVKMPRGDIGSIERYPVPHPTAPEQQKIAKCLTSLDDLIAAEGGKLDALRRHKQGLMQQLFPQPGETVPRLRFPEFEDATEWETKALGDICDFKAGEFVAAAGIAETASSDLYPCYGGNGLRGYVRSFTHDGRYVLVGRQGALCGNVNLFDGRFHATEHALIATPKSGVDTGWLFYALTGLNLNRFSIGQAQPGLSVGVLNCVPTAAPTDEDEQTAIADCLLAVDSQIASEAQRLHALTTHKKGLMQQLFPAPETP